jgi:hypothetical protein
MRERLREYPYSKRKPPAFDDQNEQLRLTVRKQYRDAQKKDDAAYFALLPQDDEDVEDEIVETMYASLDDSDPKQPNIAVATFDLKSFGTTTSPRRPRISPDEEVSTFIEVVSSKRGDDSVCGPIAFPVYVVPRHFDRPSECAWLYPLQSHSNLRSEEVAVYGQCLPHWPTKFHRSQTRANFASAKDDEEDSLLSPHSLFSPGNYMANAPAGLGNLISVPALSEEFPNVEFEEHRLPVDIKVLLETLSPNQKLGAHLRDQIAEEDIELRKLAKLAPQASSSASSQSASTSSSSFSSPPLSLDGHSSSTT